MGGFSSDRSDEKTAYCLISNLISAHVELGWMRDLEKNTWLDRPLSSMNQTYDNTKNENLPQPAKQIPHFFMSDSEE